MGLMRLILKPLVPNPRAMEKNAKNSTCNVPNIMRAPEGPLVSESFVTSIRNRHICTVEARGTWEQIEN